MADLAKLKAAYEKAVEKAGKLTGEYESRRQKALDDLRERYRDRINEATADAYEAQKAYLDAEAAQALLDRPDAESVLNSPAMQGEGAERLRRAYEEARSE
jgi:hypothetical protein